MDGTRPKVYLVLVLGHIPIFKSQYFCMGIPYIGPPTVVLYCVFMYVCAPSGAVSKAGQVFTEVRSDHLHSQDHNPMCFWGSIPKFHRNLAKSIGSARDARKARRP